MSGTSTGLAPEQVLGKAYDARLMRRVSSFVAPHWRLLVLALALMPITVAFEVAQPYLLKVAIDDHIAATPPSLDGLGVIAIVYIALVGLQTLSGFAQMYALQLLGQRSMYDLRLGIYQHVLSQRTSFFDRMPVGRLMTRMVNDIETINEMFASGVVTLVADLVKLAAILAMMLYLDVHLTLMTFVTLPVLILLVDFARRVMRTSFRTIRVKLAAINAFTAEHLSGIKVVQAFSRERSAHRDYDQINGEYRDANLGAIRADAAMYAGVESIGVISVACIAWFAGGRLDDALSVGLVVAFIEYINKFFIPVRDMSAKYTVMQSAMAATERIMVLLDTDEPDAPTSTSTDAGSGPSSSPSAGERPSSGGPAADLAVEFCDVEFGYREDEPVLRGVSLSVPRGKTVAVVGATGSGKSTLIKLLTRLYEPQRGTIRVGGVDIRAVAAEALRQRVTVVSQDVYLFSGTVAENVELGLVGGRAEAPSDQRAVLVGDALARVGADRVLERRDATADEEVAERGSNFSGGERQLIAFARALARDPEILVLDEATAHVDPEAEAWIERGLAELMKNRTTLVIAHRLSTIRNADQIAVMARGRIVEQGSHDQLVAMNGVYAQFERTFSRTG